MSFIESSLQRNTFPTQTAVQQASDISIYNLSGEQQKAIEITIEVGQVAKQTLGAHQAATTQTPAPINLYRVCPICCDSCIDISGRILDIASLVICGFGIWAAVGILIWRYA